jgi:hypothetical protein
MTSYRVSFYKDLLNSAGHSFKCLQRQIVVLSDDPSRAQILAAQLIDNDRLNADCVEVMPLAGAHDEFEHSSGGSPARGKHASRRVA